MSRQSNTPPSMPSPGMPPPRGKRYDREKSREMSKRVAQFLSDFSEDLFEQGSINATLNREIVAAVAPVVMDMAMKGIFK